MKKINILLTITTFLILIASIFLVAFPSENKNNNILNKEIKNGFKAKTFVVEEKIKEQPFIVREDHKRYVEKVWEYHDKLQKARDKTFFR